jgi:hypothetical protein
MKAPIVGVMRPVEYERVSVELDKRSLSSRLHGNPGEHSVVVFNDETSGPWQRSKRFQQALHAFQDWRPTKPIPHQIVELSVGVRAVCLQADHIPNEPFVTAHFHGPFDLLEELFVCQDHSRGVVRIIHSLTDCVVVHRNLAKRETTQQLDRVCGHNILFTHTSFTAS